MGINGHRRLIPKEVDAPGITTSQGGGDFRIGADGIAAEHLAEFMDGPVKILQDRLGR